MLPARWPLPQADGGVDDRAEHRYPEDRHEGHPEPAPAAHPVIHHSYFRLYEDAPGAASAHPAPATYLAGVTTDRRRARPDEASPCRGPASDTDTGLGQP